MFCYYFNLSKHIFTLVLSKASPAFHPILGITKPLPKQAEDKHILTVNH